MKSSNHYLLVACCLLAISEHLLAQSSITNMGARGAGVANTTAALPDAWGLFNNVAGLATLKEISANAAYDVKPQLTAANRGAFTLNVPLKKGTSSIGTFRFGDALYNEQILAIGYANKFGIASLGGSVNLIQYNAVGFGTKHLLTFNFGGIANLTKQLSIGAHIQNVRQSKISEATKERLPATFSVGVGLKPSEKVFFAIEINKNIDFKPTYKAGLEYQFLTSFFARTGINLYPHNASLGFGFIKKRITLDYAYQYYLNGIGDSHQTSIGYKLKRK